MLRGRHCFTPSLSTLVPLNMIMLT
uniref:Uncharacterized protein n=1 Tax=Anguilla anguilla TaxID=7936 RepID=A0A0E9PIR8_ANGAN